MIGVYGTKKKGGAKANKIKNEVRGPVGKRLLRGGAWATLGRMLAVPTGVALNGLLARLLSPVEMGAYFIVLSLVAFGSNLAQLGLFQSIVRLVAESHALGNPGRARSAIIKGLVTISCAVLTISLFFVTDRWKGFAYRTFESDLVAQSMNLAAGFLIVLTLQKFLAETFRGFHDIKLATGLNELIMRILSTCLYAAIWFVYGKSDLFQALSILILCGATSVFLGAFFLIKRLRKIFEEGGDISFKELLKVSVPLVLPSIAPIVMGQVSILILAACRPHSEVALYGAVERLSLLVFMPLIIVNAVVPPLISELYAQGRKGELQQYLRQTTTLAAIPAVGMLMLFLLFGPWILRATYGEFYQNGYAILAILAISKGVNVFTGSCGMMQIMTGNQKSLVILTTVSAIAMIMASLAVVPRWGVVGVVVVFGFISTVQSLFSLMLARKHTGVWTHLSLRLATPSEMAGFMRKLRTSTE